MLVKWLYAIASVLLVSLVSLIGVLTISLSEQKLRQATFVLVSLAVGGLFGDAFIHLLPEAFAKSGARMETSVCVLAGIFVFFILEKFLHWRHTHVPESNEPIHPMGYMNLFADGIHNLIDGILIGVSYQASLKVGIATTIAVILHEIPQEMGDFGVLLHSGFGKKKALLLNFLSASLAIVGVIIAMMIGAGAEKFTILMLPLAAGGFIYIAGSDLMPELQKEYKPSVSLLQFIVMIMGVGLMLVLVLLE